MRKLISITTLVLLAIGGFYIYSQQSTFDPLSNIENNITLTPSPVSERIDIHANFTIITDNLVRNFSSPKYHNLSEDVYIKADDPTKVHVTKSGVTWSDFFKTLPMSLTKDCLTTGDGERLCNNKGSLKFYLNDTEGPNVLDKEIKDGDRLKVIYSSR